MLPEWLLITLLAAMAVLSVWLLYRMLRHSLSSRQAEDAASQEAAMQPASEAALTLDAAGENAAPIDAEAATWEPVHVAAADESRPTVAKPVYASTGASVAGPVFEQEPAYAAGAESGAVATLERDAVEVTEGGWNAPGTATVRKYKHGSNGNGPKGSTWTDRRLFKGFRTDDEDQTVPRVEPDEVPHVDKSDYAFGSLTPHLAALMPESDTRREREKRELNAAGFYSPHAWHNFAAFRYLAVVIPLVMFGALLVAVPPAAELPVIVMLVLGCILGWAVPGLYIKNRAAERAYQIEHAMPDMLDMLNMCVSQGLTVQESLVKIGRELRPVYPALSQELSIVAEQAEVGSLEHALRNFARRVDIPEVHSFSSLLIQTERMGTSVSDALTEYSDGMRESLRQQADERANKSTFKILFPTVLCLMPAVFIILMGPAIIELTTFFGDGRQAVDSGLNALETLSRQ